MATSTEIVELELPDGEIVLVRAENLDADSTGPTDIGFHDRSFSAISSTLRGVATEIRNAVRAAEPDLIEVQLGIELAVKGSKLVCLLADAEANTTLTVRLEWNRSRGDST